MTQQERYREEVTALVESGWHIESETPDRVVLVKRNFGTATGHLLIAVFTIWWALGVPNLLYAAYKYVSDSDRTVVWKDATEQRTLSDATTGHE